MTLDPYQLDVPITGLMVFSFFRSSTLPPKHGILDDQPS